MTCARACDVVLEVEYADAPFAAACAAGLRGVTVQRRDVAVGTPGSDGYVAEWFPS